MVVNCLSIDVEGFVESNLQSLGWDPQCLDNIADHYEIESNTDCVLEILNDMGVKGTFFFVGRLAAEIPNMIRKVAELGHEVACHSYMHLRIPGSAKDEFRGKLDAAKKQLEDVSGQEVLGFRAPEFSIIASSLWALDILNELGFAYDSSVYPIGFHDVYGISGASTSIHKLSNGLIEFPMATISILGKRFPFGGGGYFRLYPLFVTKWCLDHVNREGNSCMLYMHPYELGPIVPTLSGLSSYRRFRHYYNCGNAGRRLPELLRAFRFAPAIDILRYKGCLEGNSCLTS
jgi:polysaccharide deacetylase family protein (PEP-CTERM system associated)